MADVVVSQLIANGPRNWGYVFTNESDGTGETNVVKVDGSSTGPLGVVIGGTTIYPASHIKIREIEYDISPGLKLEIIWDATSPQVATVLGGFGRLRYFEFGGLAAVGSTGALITGATGKILFTTVGATPGASYTVFLRGSKGIPQS
jgi:hypothetical protein